jgi:hypothetical protein
MWTCRACGAVVEDERWEVCWRCSSPRTLEGAALAERQRVVHEKTGPANAVRCLRCKVEMRYGGTKRFHEGTRQWGFWLGDLGELFQHRERYDVYLCPRCGKLEFFLDGVGDAARGEPPA